jgi:mevalonate kinase
MGSSRSGSQYAQWMGLRSVISFSSSPNHPSTAAEVVIHGEPSGLDNTTSCFGGAVRLNRSLGRFETLPHLPSMNILLTNTKSPRKTKLLVKKVRELNEALPLCVKPIFESIEAISQEFLQMIEPSVSPLPSCDHLLQARLT